MSCFGGVASALACNGGLVDVGDIFALDLVDFLSAEVALAFIVFLGAALGFGTVGGVFSVSLISPSSRLSSASGGTALDGGINVFSIAGEAAVIGAEDSSSP